MSDKKWGTVVAIGGSEDKSGDRIILNEIGNRMKSGKLVVTAVASEEPQELLIEYRDLFSRIDNVEVHVLDIHNRQDAFDEEKAALLDDAGGIFFTGGDQLRITSQIGDSPIFYKIKAIYERGGLVAGTSAGASVMCSTMLTGGRNSESPKAGGITMAPGLGLIADAIIDQHFAARGRMGRLLCAVAENPRTLGIGIDEDTAIFIENDRSFTVMGRGAVYVIDGTNLSYSNIAEEEPSKTVSIYDLRLHVLSHGDSFDLEERTPSNGPTQAVR